MSDLFGNTCYHQNEEGEDLNLHHAMTCPDAQQIQVLWSD